MDNTERLNNLERLEAILKNVSQLRVALAIQGQQDADPDMRQIWDGVQALQRTLCNQAVLEGYHIDALEQANRVWELILEWVMAPDDLQFASIGYACDLAAEKIKRYQRMVGYAQQVRHPEAA